MNIIRRSTWDKNKIPYGKYQSMVPKRIVMHHSYSPKIDEFKGARTIEGIRNYHVNHNGWSDIGYHFIIGPDGSIYEGRPITVIGAHCGGRVPKGITKNFGNTGSIGVCVIGNYDSEKPTEAALLTIRKLITFICNIYKWDETVFKEVYGHCENRSIAPKSCPGKNLFIELFGENRWNNLKF